MGRPKGSKNSKPQQRNGDYKKIPCTCIKCGVEFTYRKCVKNPQKKCKKCLVEERKARFAERHPDWHQKKQREYALKREYGLTPEQYQEMLEAQGGVCAICGGPQKPKDKNFCVDHDHKTGKVRGLLCHQCNLGIGMFGDNTLGATRYLMGYAKQGWDDYFMNLAVLVSSRSKDRSTKVGAVIVQDKVIISTGYNGFPRGMNDDIDERHERPLKYLYTCHAEENAIFNAARIGALVQGSDIYVTMFPCTKCARGIIQSQIKRVFVPKSSIPERWKEELETSKKMFQEVGIEVICLERADGLPKPQD